MPDGITWVNNAVRPVSVKDPARATRALLRTRLALRPASAKEPGVRIALRLDLTLDVDPEIPNDPMSATKVCEVVDVHVRFALNPVSVKDPVRAWRFLAKLMPPPIPDSMNDPIVATRCRLELRFADIPETLNVPLDARSM